MHRSAVAIICLATIACSDDNSGARRVIVRDSAGVAIVENAGNLWTSPLHWTASAEPVVRIGAVEGADEYMFDGIRGLVVLSDGRVVVANSGDRSVRWYDADGRFLFRRGGEGEGPGEFNYLGDVTVLDGDAVIAVDWASQRFITFGPDGDIGPTRRITGLPAPPGRMWRTGDGHWILGISGASTSQLGDNVEAGVYWLTGPILRLTDQGELEDTVGTFVTTEIEVATMPNGGFRFGPPPFGRRMSYALLNDQLIIGTSDRMQYDLYSLDGTLVGSVRAPDIDLRMSAETETAYMSHLREQVEQSPPEMHAEGERYMANLTLPDSVPAYSTILIDSDNRVWLGESRYDSSPSRQFLVFDSDGRFIGRAAVPESFRVMAIRDGRIWGSWRDDLGVEYVVAHTLEPNQ